MNSLYEQYKRSEYFQKPILELYQIFNQKIKLLSRDDQENELNLLGYAMTFDCKYLSYKVFNDYPVQSTNHKSRLMAKIDNMSLWVIYNCSGCCMCINKNDI
jgi:hypothetical protein